MSVERRMFPRIDTSLSVEIATERGDVVKLHSTNISSAGMQLECPAGVASLLIADPNEIVFTQNVVFDLKSELPTEKGVFEVFVCQAKVVYVRRSAQEAYQIGVEFLELTDESFVALSRFYDNSSSKSKSES